MLRKFGLTQNNYETCASATESLVEIQNSMADKFNSYNDGDEGDHPAFFGDLKNIATWKYNATKTYDVKKECLDPYVTDTAIQYPEANFERIYQCACMNKTTCEIPYLDDQLLSHHQSANAQWSDWDFSQTVVDEARRREKEDSIYYKQ